MNDSHYISVVQVNCKRINAIFNGIVITTKTQYTSDKHRKSAKVRWRERQREQRAGKLLY